MDRLQELHLGGRKKSKKKKKKIVLFSEHHLVTGITLIPSPPKLEISRNCSPLLFFFNFIVTPSATQGVRSNPQSRRNLFFCSGVWLPLFSVKGQTRSLSVSLTLSLSLSQRYYFKRVSSLLWLFLALPASSACGVLRRLFLAFLRFLSFSVFRVFLPLPEMAGSRRIAWMTDHFVDTEQFPDCTRAFTHSLTRSFLPSFLPSWIRY